MSGRDPVIRRDPVRDAGESYDLIVVGGGIHGATLLLEAARNGLRTLLLERADFGSGTSWNSLRILHGGLRYLQKLDLRRFRQSIAERRWFMRNFPRHVRPLPCLMPLYGEGLRRRSVMRVALAVNDLLSMDRNRGLPRDLHLPRGRVLDASATREHFPAVREEGLQGAALWYDGVMENPPRILMETLRWAAALGGRPLNYVEARRIDVEGGRVSGVVAHDRIGDRTLRFQASRVALCVGSRPRSLDRDGVTSHPRIPPPSLAFNLVLRRPLPGAQALAVSPREPDGQIYFLHGRGALTLAGTTHAPWSGRVPRAPDDPLVVDTIRSMNEAVPGWGLDVDDVARILPGVLPARDSDGAELVLRERIVDHARAGGPQGLVTVVGIKYTTARDVARQALEFLVGRAVSGPAVRPPNLDTIPAPAFGEFMERSAEDPSSAKDLVLRLLTEEAVQTLEDLVLRRMDWGLDPERARVASDRVRSLLDGTGRSLPAALD